MDNVTEACKEIRQTVDVLKAQIRELQYEIKELQESCQHVIMKGMGSHPSCKFCDKVFWGM